MLVWKGGRVDLRGTWEEANEYNQNTMYGILKEPMKNEKILSILKYSHNTTKMSVKIIAIL